MTVVLATIAAIFLMIPGFAFIAGVNLTDKNIREVVFRGTPAELAYVVAISLLVHLVAALIPTTEFNPAELVNSYAALTGTMGAHPIAPTVNIRSIVVDCLAYFAAAGTAGLLLGWLLGLGVRKWGWRFFVKHRWMLALVRLKEEDTVYARVLVTPSFAQGKDVGNAAMVIEGWIRDCYFTAEGTLLYLVFSSFEDSTVSLTEPPVLHPTSEGKQRLPSGGSFGQSRERLVLEGRHVAMVQYERVLTPRLSDLRKVAG